MELAIALARHGDLHATADCWRALISEHHHRVLKEEQWRPLQPVMPLVAAEILTTLRKDAAPLLETRWRVEHDRTEGAEQYWESTHYGAMTLSALESILKYVAVVIAHKGTGPGKVIFRCLHDPSSENTRDDLGEMAWEWNSAREVRLLYAKDAPPGTARRF